MENDYKKWLCWDAHTCISLHPQARISELEAHHAQGVNFVSINIGMDMTSPAQIMSVIASFRQQIKDHPKLIQVQSIDDVVMAHQHDKLAIAFDLEGGLPLMESPDMVFLFHLLGVRQIHLAYNRNNSLAGGCYDKDMPLSNKGKQIVGAINQAGILMDCSHTGYQSSLDIMEYSQQPVIFSHANVRVINANLRNITDEQIDACAQQGGVIGVNGVEKFLNNELCHRDALIEQIDYIVQRVGPKHVGIGLDYVYDRHLPELADDVDPNYWWPPSHGYSDGLGDSVYAHISELPALVEGMKKLGYDEQTIKNILGDNFFRIAKEVWAVSSEVTD